MVKGKFHIIDNFRNAFSGISILVKEGKIFRVHLLIAISVIVAGILFKIEKHEWLMIILTIGMVLTAEGINTSLEKLSDYLTPDFDHVIKKVKDIAAAAVLIASLSAALLGLIIFIPYLAELIKQ